MRAMEHLSPGLKDSLETAADQEVQPWLRLLFSRIANLAGCGMNPVIA